MIKGGIIQQVIPWDGVIELPTDIQLKELPTIELPTDIVLEEVVIVINPPTGIKLSTYNY